MGHGITAPTYFSCCKDYCRLCLAFYLLAERFDGFHSKSSSRESAWEKLVDTLHGRDKKRGDENIDISTSTGCGRRRTEVEAARGRE